MVEDESSGEGFSDDVFNEFEDSLKHFENLRKLIDDIDSEEVEGDYRFRRVCEDGFNGFDVKLRVRIPLVKSLMFNRSYKRQKTIHIETIEDGDDLLVVGMVPALNPDEVEVKTGWGRVFISTRSGLRKLITVRGADPYKKPKVTFKNGIIEIRLKKRK